MTLYGFELSHHITRDGACDNVLWWGSTTDVSDLLQVADAGSTKVVTVCNTAHDNSFRFSHETGGYMSAYSRCATPASSAAQQLWQLTQALLLLMLAFLLGALLLKYPIEIRRLDQA